MTIHGGKGVFDSLGALSPDNWRWDGYGFYDNHPGFWSKWTDKRGEWVDYETFQYRAKQAAELNAVNQEASDLTAHEMRECRDEENGFRIVELGIPDGEEVTVLAKPEISDRDGKQMINLCDPDATAHTTAFWSLANIGQERFQFRILKGYTVENLLKHRNGSLGVYAGFGLMGLFTMWSGQREIEDGLEMTYIWV